MADKHTKKELFETLLVFASAAGAEDWIINGLKHELELLARKSNGSKAPNAKKLAEQNAIMGKIANVLNASETPMRATAIAEALGDGTTVQRVSSLLRKMVKSGIVLRIEDKKVATFALAVE